MKSKKKVLLKLTGEVFLSEDKTSIDTHQVKEIARQIQHLTKSIQFGIVIGGGNILRGATQGKKIGLTPTMSHYIGMFATIINGLLLQDIFTQHHIKTVLLSAIFCPQVSMALSEYNIEKALDTDCIIIFVGGTGAPFFTTDTNAVVRGLQIGAHEIWKATGVDGVFDSDPEKNPNATYLKKIKYSEAISKKLGIMDMTALIMAEKHNVDIRVFNIFAPDALIQTSEHKEFGSLIHT